MWARYCQLASKFSVWGWYTYAINPNVVLHKSYSIPKQKSTIEKILDIIIIWYVLYYVSMSSLRDQENFKHKEYCKSQETQ